MPGFDDTSEIVEREREREREITFQSKVVCAHFKFHGGFMVLWNA